MIGYYLFSWLEIGKFAKLNGPEVSHLHNSLSITNLSILRDWNKIGVLQWVSSSIMLTDVGLWKMWMGTDPIEVAGMGGIPILDMWVPVVNNSPKTN